MPHDNDDRAEKALQSGYKVLGLDTPDHTIVLYSIGAGITFALLHLANVIARTKEA